MYYVMKDGQFIGIFGSTLKLKEASSFPNPEDAQAYADLVGGEVVTLEQEGPMIDFGRATVSGGISVRNVVRGSIININLERE